MIASNLVDKYRSVQPPVIPNKENRRFYEVSGHICRSNDSADLIHCDAITGDISKTLDDIIDRLRRGTAVNDKELVMVYEAKMTQLKKKAFELETKLANFEKSNQSASISTLQAEQQKLNEENAQLTKQLQDVQAAKDVLLEENRREVDLCSQLRLATKEFREKFERASNLALEKQKKCEELEEERRLLTEELSECRMASTRSGATKEARIQELIQELEQSTKQCEKTTQLLNELDEKLKHHTEDSIQREQALRHQIEQERKNAEKQLNAFKENAEREISQLKERLKQAESQGEQSVAELQRMRNLREEMLKLAGKF